MKRILAAALAAGLLAGCAAGPQTAAPAAPLDAGAFLPGVPAEGTWQKSADEAAYKEGLALRPTRGQEAESLALLLKHRHFLAYFSQAAGFEISPSATPATNALLRAAVLRSAGSLKAGKRHFARPRPFVVHPEDPTCSRRVASDLNKHGSYPSGHSARSMLYALALSSVCPEREEAILKAALAVGTSRWICGHHWASDVQGGQLLAAASFARLVADPQYRELTAAARSEILDILEKQKHEGTQP